MPRPDVQPTAPPRAVRLFPPFGLGQIFFPLPKSSEARPTLNVEYEYNEVLKLRFSAREGLGVEEQTLLLVLLELAQEQYQRHPKTQFLSCDSPGTIPAQLWASLNDCTATPPETARATLMLQCSWRELQRRCGLSSMGGPAIGVRRKSLERLCEVTVWEDSFVPVRRTRSHRLASWALGDNQRVHVALNYRLAEAIVSPGYVQILLSERLKLPSKAMLVHAFLSAWLRPGTSGRIGYEKMAERLWPRAIAEAELGRSQRRHLHNIRAALRAIDRLPGWEISLGTTVAEVARARIVHCPAAACAPVSCTRAQRRDTPSAEMRHFAVETASYPEQVF